MVEIMLQGDRKAQNSSSVSIGRTLPKAFSDNCAWQNQLRYDNF